MEGVFISGIDTGVGKSSVCGGILKLLHGSRKVAYWKPIQTGTIVSDDTRDLKTFTDLPDDCFMDPTYRFAEPLAPYVAAKKWGKRIDLEVMIKAQKEKQKAGYFTVIEGAGGLLVPFNENDLQIDLIQRLGLPSIFVAEDRVGAINQCLLTLIAARERNLPVLGIILTRSRRTFGNAESISHFGKVEILAEFDPTDDVRSLIAQVGGNDRLRDLFKVASLPA